MYDLASLCEKLCIIENIIQKSAYILPILRYAYYRYRDADNDGNWEDGKTCSMRRTRSETRNDGTLICDAMPFSKVATVRSGRTALCGAKILSSQPNKVLRGDADYPPHSHKFRDQETAAGGRRET